jgi:transposase
MWTLSGSVHVHLASEPVDGRKGIQGLMGLVQTAMQQDPYSGHAFVFLGRRRDLVKCLLWNRGGFVMLQKRLEQGRFKIPTVAANATRIQLSGVQLSMLLDGMDVMAAPVPKHWEPQRIDKGSHL